MIVAASFHSSSKLGLFALVHRSHVGIGRCVTRTSAWPHSCSITWCNHPSSARNGNCDNVTRRRPRRRSASTSQCNHTHTLRNSKATPTYNSRSTGCRVLVRMRAWCICR